MKINMRLNTLILGGIIVMMVIYFGWNHYQNKVNKLQDELETEQKLKNALLDTVKIYQNKEKEWVAEKLTIQATIKTLEKINGQLTNSQKELLIRIKSIEKTSSVIAAALIETNLQLDSLKKSVNYYVGVDTTNKYISFSDSTISIQYNIGISNVLPAYSNKLPELKFNKFSLPNKQFIEFHWKNDRKRGYPVSFSVTNTNEYIKVVDINSYIIPKVKKSELDPTAWNKFTKWFGKNSKSVLTIGVFGAAGIGAGILLF